MRARRNPHARTQAATAPRRPHAARSRDRSSGRKLLAATASSLIAVTGALIVLPGASEAAAPVVNAARPDLSTGSALTPVSRTVPMRPNELPLTGPRPEPPAWVSASHDKAAQPGAHGAKVATTNWAGQIYTGPQGTTAFTEVGGDWHVPSVAPSASQQDVATWIGIGGVGTTSIVQVGTTATTVGGVVRYSAWVELFPAAAEALDEVVHPGDAMEAVIKERSAGIWDVAIEDVTQGWRATSTTLVLSMKYQTSAEWITERGYTVTNRRFGTLADFDTTRFTHLSVSATALTAAEPTETYMVDTSTQIIAYPGTLLGTTTGHFTTTYGTPLPTIASVNPAVGSANGGTSVTITGTYIVPTLFESVHFGTRAVSGTVNTSGDVTVTTPPEAAGAVKVTVTTTDGTSAVSASGTFTFVTPAIAATRIYGQTSDATAAAEMEHQFPSASGDCPASRSVVLATAAGYPDALASAYLARSLGTGTLLTTTGTLSTPTASAISQEGIDHVYVVGGPLAVSTQVLLDLSHTKATTCGGAKGTGDYIAVSRIWGPTEYATAEQVAVSMPLTHVATLDVSGAYAAGYDAGGGSQSSAPAPGSLKTAVVATGDSFQDAESASTFAYGESVPILLTTPAMLSPQTATALSALAIRQVILMGGPLAVSNGVVTQLEGMGISVLRVSGTTYTGSAVELAKFELQPTPFGASWAQTGAVTIAQGASYSDGIAGAVVAADGPSATKREPLLLTFSPERAGTTLATFFKSSAHQLGITHLTVLGGPAAVSQTVVTGLLLDVAAGA